MNQTNFRSSFQRILAALLVLLLTFQLVPVSQAWAAQEVQTAFADEDYVVLSVERFTIGQGFYMEPTRVPLHKGESVSDILQRQLGDKLVLKYGGNYLSAITDANLGPDHVAVPAYITAMKNGPTTEETVAYFNDQGFTGDEIRELGEFTYSLEAGWYYFVNNQDTSLGIKEYRPRSGDVIRLQYTLCGLGADLLGRYHGQSDSFAAISDKDELYRAMAMVNAMDAETRQNPAVQSAYAAASQAAQGIITQQSQVDRAAQACRTAIPYEKAQAITGQHLAHMAAIATPQVGSVGGEWLILGLARSGQTVPAAAYYKNVEQFVRAEINDCEQLHRAKSTENSRVILALTALGYDVTNVAGHNLLQGLTDMTYVQKQGINGPIWALIALDSHHYPAPSTQVESKKLLEVILDRQNLDGGWSLSGQTSDADLTGMALQALAPYYEQDVDVRQSVNHALEKLSFLQNDDGTFASIDGTSVESTAQVVVALSALGIDAAADRRFTKNGHSALDGLMSFYLGDGFSHVPGGDYNQMATEQAYYALTAYDRFAKGQNSLYDMTDVTIGSLAQPQLGVKNIASSGKITLSWPAVDGADSYQVYVREGKTGSFRLLKEVQSTKLNHTSAKAGTTYYYQVRALAGAEEGPFSTVKSRTCDLPRTDITFTTRSDGKPVLHWDKVPGAVKYVVYRSVDGGQFEEFYTTASTQLTNGSARTGHTYAYQVQAVCANKYGNSALSPAASILCGKAPALKLTANASTGKTVLTWNKVPGAVEYKIYAKQGKDGTYSLLHTAKSTKLTHGSAQAGKTYYYQVCAVAADGSKTALSTTKSRTTDLGRPSVKLSTRNGDPYLTWNKVSGASKYEIWCADGKGEYTRLTSTTGTRLTHTSAKSGHTYSYQVRAICSNSYGNSAYSASVSMKVK